MKADILVLGAGIVGVSVALHLVKAGRSVVLVDRQEAGAATSFGNAGLIQREGVAPHAFPQDLPTLLAYAGNRGTVMRYHWRALPRLSRFLAQYWWFSRAASYRKIVEEYASFIAHAIDEHAPLIEEAGAGALIGKAGWMQVYRGAAGFAAARAQAGAHERFGITHTAYDGAQLRDKQPGIRAEMAGGIHWHQPWTVRDPLALTRAYLDLLRRLGGQFVLGEAATLRQAKGKWEIDSQAGAIAADHAVIALGPWADGLLRRLGRRLPLGVKRGYHMHYAPGAGAGISLPIYDDAGFLLAPMVRGIRLTTGAEFALLAAPARPAQLASAEKVARASYALGERLDPAPWLGARPCTPDMKPIIGPEGREGLWLAIGHAHHGLTLGPATGRLLAEMMTGKPPFIDPSPYSVQRF